MTFDEFPDARPTRPIWLVTLADLALLLVGFFVLLQANQQVDRRAIAAGLRVAFDGEAAPAAAEPMPVSAAAASGFAPGSAMLATSPDTLVAWVRDALADPRVTIRITGSVDGSPGDVDAVTGSAAILAADRARHVAALLAAAGIAPTGRITIASAAQPSRGRRIVLVSTGFAGDRQAPAARQDATGKASLTER